MKKNQREKQQRFAFRKLSVGLVSATVASLFFATSIATAPVVSAQSINYTYVTEQELTDAEKESIIKELPGLAQETDANYYLVYRPVPSPSKALPKTGVLETSTLALAGLSLLVLAVKVGKKGKKELAAVIFLTATGASLLAPTSSALTSHILAQFNHAVEISTGQVLPTPIDIEGYVYVGYLKDSKAVEELPAGKEKPADNGNQEIVTEVLNTAPSHQAPDKVVPEQHVSEEVLTVLEDIPFSKVTEHSTALLEGIEKITQEGKNGQRKVTVKNTYVGGKLVKSEPIASEVVLSPVEEVTTIGKKVVTEILSNLVDLPSLPITEQVLSTTEPVEFETQTVNNPELPEGTERLVQEGQNGERTITIKQIFIAGQLVKEEKVSSEITKPATPKIIEIGTKKAPITSIPDTAPTHTIPALVITEEVTSHTETIGFENQVIYDDTLLDGTSLVVQDGKVGQKSIESKKTFIDGVLVKSETLSETVRQAPIPQIVRVGTKPITEVPATAPSHELPEVQLSEEVVSTTESVAFETQEILDDTLIEGSRQVQQEGQAGVRSIDTKNYYADGVLIKSEVVSDTVTTAPVPQIVRVGTKKADVVSTEVETSTAEIPFATKVTDSPNLYVGEEEVRVEGQVGSEEITTTYVTINGVRQPNPTVTKTVLTPAVDREVLKGTKPIEGTESDSVTVEIPYGTDYIDDPTLPADTTKSVTPGVPGSKKITTTYKTIKGVRQENPTVTEEITQQPVNEVIARGPIIDNKPRVVITNLVKNEESKSATISYQLTDESTSLRKAIALLYDNTGKLVQEQEIANPNGQLTLENLDFYTDYTVKTRIVYASQGTEKTSDQETILESMRKFDLVYKKIEIKDIDAVTVYRRKDGKYIGQEFLEEKPASVDELFVKVTSDRFKEVYLPVSSVEETTLNGKPVFKLVSAFDQLVQDKDAQYVANREFYIPKMATDATTYTSFKSLIEAMKKNTSGTFKLGAHLDANEIPVGDVASYVQNFNGTLDGLNDGYAFSISNLKAPLFFNLGGKVQNLDIKNASLNTTSKNPLATISVNANKATITNVAVEASIKGPQNVSGLVHSATNTTIKDVSFKGTLETTGTGASLTGGILGNGTMSSVGNAKVDATIILPGTENQVAGGIVGRTMLVYDVPGSVYNAYATGSIVTTETGAILGGIAGSNQVTGSLAPHVGNLTNVVSSMTGPTSLVGLAVNPNGKIKNGFTTTSETLANVAVISADEAKHKVEAMNIVASVEDSPSLNLNQYSVNYLTLKQAQADHATAYYNMEKILPFYNKELLVYYGNKIATDDKLNKVRLLAVVPMKDDAFVMDVHTEKANINKIMLHYADGTVDYKTVSYKEDFKNKHVVEYTIAGTDLIYTPESFLNDRSALVRDLVTNLSAVTLDSEVMKTLIGYPTKLDANRQTGTIKDFYFADSYEKVMANLDSNVRKLLVASLNGQGQASETYIKERITDNKEAFILGLTYLNRWYDLHYGNVNTKELTIFEPDFFGNDAASALDMILAIGNGGYEVLRAHNNVTTYASIIGKQNKQASLFDMVEAYRKLFLPNLTDNEWFKQTTKAYIVESKSQVAEAAAKQENAAKHSKYALAVYDKITNPTWEYRQMLLPLLTLPQEDIFIISNMNTIAIGSYEHYVDDYKDPAKRDTVRQLVNKAADMQRDNADFWYKILDEENRDKLFRTVLNNEGFKMYGSDGQNIYRNLLADVDAIQDYYGPINKWYAEGGTKTAYANGKETFYVLYNMLDNYGTTLYTHEMVHNQDGSTYLKGYGRRMGQGMELFADGLLQNVSSVDRTILGFNAVFTSDAANRVHVGDPVARFNSEQDFNEYFHNQFDVLYLLDYIEGMTVLGKPNSVKKDWFLKLENYYIQENGKDTHAGNKMTTLTEEDAAKLTTFDDLINGSIIDRYGYQSVKYNQNLQRNGYYSVPMFAGNYSALSNPNGSPGDFMFRRMAFELIAAKGYTDGFVPYTSNQLSDYAMSQNSITYDNWNKKNTGLITDKHVLDQVFNGQYASWEEFKKAMFMERVDKAKAGKLKPFTIQYELGVANSTKEVTIASYEDLQRLINEAIDADIQRKSYGSDKSRLSTLKFKIYQALMNATNDFRSSIFTP